MITMLNGEWQINSPEIHNLKGCVPGSLLTSLLDNDLIDEPSYRDNAEDIREKYLYENYTFSRKFSLSEEQLKKHNFLFAEGIDTIASIFINGVKIADVCDMFMRNRIKVDNSILATENEIKIEFISPYKYIAEHDGGLFRSFGVTELKAPCIRKAGYSFGWDWCANLADIGIYRDIYLLSTDEGYLSDYKYTVDFLPDGKAKLCVTVNCVCTGKGEVKVSLFGHGYSSALSKPLSETTTFEFLIDNPELWYPNGYGKQSLYNLKIEVGDKEYNYKLGLRKIEVDDKIDNVGRNFAIYVNGRKIFVKGCNYIPEDLVLGRINEKRTRNLLTRVANNHSNTVRVWGGGLYPDDYFYDICDELGLLVFQDLMFACASYDMRDEKFKSLIVNETADALKRIRNHACICVIDGDNECEDGINGNGKDIMEQYSVMRGIITETVKQNCDAYFLPSSPSSGKMFTRQNDTENLDTHYWSVWHGLKPYEEYTEISPRLLSEFGIQSFPSYETVKKFTQEDERYASSYVLTYHQRDYSFTNDKNIYYVGKYYKKPQDMKELCYLSSLVQAEGLKLCVEHLRMNKPRCNGAIYWQLNDCWMGQSESVIDYCGMPKAAGYYERNFFAPHLVVVREQENEIEIGISNDTANDVEYKVMVHLGDDVEKSFKDVADMGMHTCQLVCWDMSKLTDDNAERVKIAVKQTGVEISAFWCGWSGPQEWNFIDGYHTLGLIPIAYREQRITDLKKGSDFAEKIGVTDVITHMGFLPENCKTDEYYEVVRAIKEVAEYCKSKGQWLLFETGQETPITLKRTIEFVGTGNLGINFDPANLLLYGKGNPCDAIDVFGEYIRNVHGKDGEYPTDPRYLGEEKRIGDGRVNFPLLITKLKNIGYDGPVNIEREIVGEKQIEDIKYAKSFLEGIINE